MIIVFEGIDGCGKDTQLDLALTQIKKWNKHNNILVTREPSLITKSGKKIKKLLKKGFKSNKQALNLYTQNRLELAERIDKMKKLFPNLIILSSRSELSTLAYQSNKEVSFQHIVKKRKKLDKKGVYTPAYITFLFTVSPKEAVARIEKRWEKKDVFEKGAILEQKQEKYLEAAKFLRETEGQLIFEIDGNQSVEQVAEEVKRILENFLPYEMFDMVS